MSESASSIYEAVNSMRIFHHCEARVCVFVCGYVWVGAQACGGEWKGLGYCNSTTILECE